MRRNPFFTWLLVFVILLTQLGQYPVFASEEETTNRQRTTDTTDEIATTDATDTSSHENWIAGEAIVLTTGMPLLQGSVDEDETIVRTVSFDLSGDETGVEDLPLLGSSIATPDSISISLVHSDTETTEELMARLEQQSNVVYVEPNQKIEAKSITDHMNALWGLRNLGQNNGIVGADINVEALQGTLTDTDAVVAVLDTGTYLEHPDLQAYLWQNPYAETGELSGQYGYDFVNWDDDPSDDNGHGTHCAGIVASMIEMAETTHVSIMSLKMLDASGNSGSFTEMAAYSYIYQAQQLGINVVAVNNSWGGSMLDAGYSSDIMNLVITLVGEAGALSICAAGNDGENMDNYKDYPSGLENPYVISVAASGSNDRLTSFSNYGVKTVDLAAPGVNILSTYTEPYFEPTAFTEEEKEKWITYSEDFTDGTMPELVDMDDLISGITSRKLTVAYGTPGAEQSLYLVNDHYFGLPEMASSLCWEYTVPEDATAGILYFPIPRTVKERETRDFSLKIQVDTVDTDCNMLVEQNVISDDGMIGNGQQEVLLRNNTYYADNPARWSTISSFIDGADGQYHTLSLYLYNLTPGGKVYIYLDSFYMSAVNVYENYPAYTYMKGTSMATPYVAGAVALLALRDPTETVLERATDLLSATRPVARLNGKLKTGGVLDLSYLDQPRPVVLNTELDTDTGQLKVNGRNLESVDQFGAPFWADVSVVSQTSEEIVLDVSDFARCYVDLTLKDAEGRTLCDVYEYYPTGDLPYTIAKVENNAFSTWMRKIFCMDGQFYALDTAGYVYQLNLKGGWTTVHDGTFPDAHGTTCTGTGEFAANDGQIAAIVTCNSSSVNKNYHCMLYDMDTDTWTNSGDLSLLMGLSNFTTLKVATGDGQFWLMVTGEDKNWEQVTRLYRYNVTKNTISLVATLPDVRQTCSFYWMEGGKLVFTQDVESVGDNSTTALPQLIYDIATNSWTTCPAMTYEKETEGTSYTSYDYFYNTNVSNDKYIVYTSVGVEGIGDIVLYDLETNAFYTVAYTTYAYSQQVCYQVAADEEYLYFFYMDETPESILVGDYDMSVTEVAFDDLAEDSRLVEQMGDVNGDNAVTVEDAVLLLQEYATCAAAMESTFMNTQKRLGDVNQDDTISVEDAVMVLTYYATEAAGLTPHF
jgi:subtilisin family serine protease